MDPSLRHELRLQGRRRADAHLAKGQETADKEPLDIPRDLPWLPHATVVLRRPAALGGLETTVDIPDHGQGWNFACDVADTTLDVVPLPLVDITEEDHFPLVAEVQTTGMYHLRDDGHCRQWAETGTAGSLCDTRSSRLNGDGT